jgi:hypothetical protein
MRDLILITSLAINGLLLIVVSENQPSRQAEQDHAIRENELLRKRLDHAADVLNRNQIPYEFDYAYSPE